MHTRDGYASGTPPPAAGTVDRVITFRIEGSRIDGIATLYDELNRVFMADEDWRLGESLDALDDLLYGGYGALLDATDVTVVIADHEHARAALGRDATIAWQRAKTTRAGFDTVAAERTLAELEAGGGRLYWDIVLEVFADHPAIALVLD